jgi:hypothetical protein
VVAVAQADQATREGVPVLGTNEPGKAKATQALSGGPEQCGCRAVGVLDAPGGGGRQVRVGRVVEELLVVPQVVVERAGFDLTAEGDRLDPSTSSRIATRGPTGTTWKPAVETRASLGQGQSLF